MKVGATADVIESQPIARANVERSRIEKASRQAGTERIGPMRRKGVRERTRSETRPRTTAAMPAAREKSAKRNPSATELVVKANEPRGVAAERRPATPPR